MPLLPFNSPLPEDHPLKRGTLIYRVGPNITQCKRCRRLVELPEGAERATFICAGCAAKDKPEPEVKP